MDFENPDNWIKQANESLLGDLADVFPALEKAYGHFKRTVDA